MKKNKGYTKQYKNDDPTTHLTDVEQQKNVLLDTIDDAKAKKIKVLSRTVVVCFWHGNYWLKLHLRYRQT